MEEFHRRDTDILPSKGNCVAIAKGRRCHAEPFGKAQSELREAPRIFKVL